MTPPKHRLYDSCDVDSKMVRTHYFKDAAYDYCSDARSSHDVMISTRRCGVSKTHNVWDVVSVCFSLASVSASVYVFVSVCVVP